jgi:methylmalonyl-CoA/ethylmalonyl-CoA epimerase
MIGKIDHVGIAVRSIAEACGLYEAMGLTVEAIEEVPHEGVRVAMIVCADDARLREKGYEVLRPEPTRGAGECWVQFVHPKSAGGVLLELSEGDHAERHPENGEPWRDTASASREGSASRSSGTSGSRRAKARAGKVGRRIRARCLRRRGETVGLGLSFNRLQGCEQNVPENSE